MSRQRTSVWTKGSRPTSVAFGLQKAGEEKSLVRQEEAGEGAGGWPEPWRIQSGPEAQGPGQRGHLWLLTWHLRSQSPGMSLDSVALGSALRCSSGTGVPLSCEGSSVALLG